METARCPAGLPGYGYSMQATAIASALVERQDAQIYRRKVREWLDRIARTKAQPTPVKAEPLAAHSPFNEHPFAERFRMTSAGIYQQDAGLTEQSASCQNEHACRTN
jgi:hypothetical protein